MLKLISILAALAVPAGSHDATIGGSLDKNAIRDVARANISEIRHCYNQGLANDPDLEGRIAVHFRIGAAGDVTESSLAESDLGDARVEGCIVDAVGSWQFPQPAGGGDVLVTYPFLLAPG